MNRKLFPGLVPLLVIAALAAAPAAAQAEPHWYKGSTPVGSAHVTVATEGKLTLSALSATIKCKLVDAEEIWNPVGGAGEDSRYRVRALEMQKQRGLGRCPKGHWKSKPKRCRGRRDCSPRLHPAA